MYKESIAANFQMPILFEMKMCNKFLYHYNKN